MGGDSLTQVPFNQAAKKFKIVGLFTHWGRLLGHEARVDPEDHLGWVCVCARALQKFPKKQLQFGNFLV